MAKQGSNGKKNAILALVAVGCLGAAGYLLWGQMSEEKPQRTPPATGPRITDDYSRVPDEELRRMAAEGEFTEEQLARFREQGRLPAE